MIIVAPENSFHLQKRSLQTSHNKMYETFQKHDDVETLFEATGHEDTCIKNSPESWNRHMFHHKSDGAGKRLLRETPKCDKADSKSRNHSNI